MNNSQIIQTLNSIFQRVDNKWVAKLAKERDPHSGSDNTFVYIEYPDQTCSDFMNTEQGIKYILHIRDVGLANFSKPIVQPAAEPVFVPTKTNPVPYLKLIVNN